VFIPILIVIGDKCFAALSGQRHPSCDFVFKVVLVFDYASPLAHFRSYCHSAIEQKKLIEEPLPYISSSSSLHLASTQFSTAFANNSLTTFLHYRVITAMDPIFPYRHNTASQAEVPLTLVRFVCEKPHQTWYRALPVSWIPTDPRESGDHMHSLFAAHHKTAAISAGMGRRRWTIKTCAVRWQGISSSGTTETSLFESEPLSVQMIFWLMEQRGWKDYVQIDYVVN